MSDIRLFVAQDATIAPGESTWVSAKGGKQGQLVIIDFFAQMAIEGRAFQIRAGDIATPLVGDVPIADTKAELCADCVAGTTIIPFSVPIGITLLPGTANQIKIQSVGVVSSAGTAFTPLPLYMGSGTAATTTGRVAAAGGVTVTAEAVTTTRLHFATGAGIANTLNAPVHWEPRVPPVLAGAACLYVQVGGTTTGPSYFAAIQYIEIPTTAVS